MTAPDPQQSGFLTIWLRDKTRPIANSINFVPGKVPANCTFIVVSASEARADLLRLVDAAQRGDRAIVAKRAGGRIARIEEFEALRASARLWQDPAALHAMRGSSDDLRRGRMTTVRSPLSPKQLGARGRA